MSLGLPSMLGSQEDADEDAVMLGRRRKFHAHPAAQAYLPFGVKEGEEQDEVGSPGFHISRRPPPSALEPAQGQEREGQWQTTYMLGCGDATGARDDSDDVGRVKKWRQGKKCLKPAYEGSGPGSGPGSSLGGSARFQDSQGVSAVLSEGTWKAAGHVPGYTGHVPASQPVPPQAGEGRTLDKSMPLFSSNYKPSYEGFRSVSKLVPQP